MGTKINYGQLNNRWVIGSGLGVVATAAIGIVTLFSGQNAAGVTTYKDLSDGSREQSGSLLIHSGATTLHADTTNRRVGIGKRSPKATLDVLGTMSGNLAVLSSMRNCTLKTSSTGNVLCGSDLTGGSGTNWSSTGSLQGAFDTRYVNVSGDSMTGALAISVTGGSRNTIGLRVINTVSGAHLHAETTLSSSGTLVFEGAASGASLWVSKFDGAGLTNCDPTTGKLTWDSTAKQFVCSTDQNTTAWSNTGSLQLRFDSRYLRTSGGTVTGSLAVRSSLSGGSLFTLSAYRGCTLKTSSTGAVTCGTDLTGGGGSNWSNTGSILSAADRKYVNIGGDTMTGSLSLSGSNLSMRVLTNLAEASLFTSTQYAGFAFFDGVVSQISASANTNGVNFDMDVPPYQNSSTDTLNVSSGSLVYLVVSPSGNVGIGTDAPQTPLEVVGTVSGSTVYAASSLRSSGSLVWEGSASGASLWVSKFDGAGLVDCDLTTNKVLWDITLGRFSCGTDLNTDLVSTGALLGAADRKYVNIGGDTMTGTLVINPVSGYALNARGTISGSLLTQNGAGSNYFLGNVGIGTTSPGVKLVVTETAASTFPMHINGVSAGTAITNVMGPVIANTDSTTGNWAGLLFSDAVGGAASGLMGVKFTDHANNYGDFAWGTRSAGGFTEKMRILSTGEVGIGTAAPKTKLEVLGTISGSAIGISGLRSCDTIDTDAQGNFVCGTDATGGSGSPEVGTSSFSGAVVRLGNTQWVKKSGDTMTGTLTLMPVSGVALNARGTISGSLITQNGPGLNYLRANTTIGDTTTKGALTVYGSGAFTGTLSGSALNIQGGNSYILGRLGIGTTAIPDTPLDVIGTISGSRLHASNSITSSGTLTIESLQKTGSGVITIQAQEYQTGAVIFGSGGAPALAINTYAQTGAGIRFGFRGVYDTELYRGGSTRAGSNSGGLVLRVQNRIAAPRAFSIITNFGSTNNTVFRVSGSGGVYSDTKYAANGADYAEWFYSKEVIPPAEVVCIDVTKSNTVKRCDRDADNNVMGITSTNPAFVGNQITGADGMDPPGYSLVGLIGQVPAKVIVENDSDAIHPGDSLTAASKPGYARKARAGESTVGVALEGLESGEGKVNVLISRRNSSLTVDAVGDKVLQTIADMKFENTIKRLVDSALLHFNLKQQIHDEVARQFSVFTSVAKRIATLASEVSTLKADMDEIRQCRGHMSPCFPDTDGIGHTVVSCNNGNCTFRQATDTECSQ